ncbi:FAD binding domain-containing protein [Rhizobium sp. TRM95111]|uniref:FAD binding domain-containing protein n=1 Tax=Rhizobium alarense TaxID=2846851 RepID=UPI001F1AB27A|nr:FAD binding domain-containing protein [Rhizobium alarense]MCF3639615.1 FAD binding domain-containing protein [Rhizobium alarense]
MSDSLERSLTVAGSIEEALSARRQGAAILAGGTWLMRDPRRGQVLPKTLVSLHALPGLAAIDIKAGHMTIGAAVTHEALGRAFAGVVGFEAVVAAAVGAANPAIRRVATVGGNLCTQDFAAADLLPVLLAMEATVELAASDGPMFIPMAAFLAGRRVLLTDTILIRVILSRDLAASAHARLPLRRAGDYPVAIVSMVLTTEGRLRVAVGSVEDVARRWDALENAFAAEPGGRPAGAERAAALAAACNDFRGRDGIEADGWYRRQVLPTLVRRSMEALLSKEVIR